MKKSLAVGLVGITVGLLAGCERAPEVMEDRADPRIIENAKKHCEPHGGVYRYIVANLAGATFDSPHVECFNGAVFDVRSGEPI